MLRVLIAPSGWPSARPGLHLCHQPGSSPSGGPDPGDLSPHGQAPRAAHHMLHPLPAEPGPSVRGTPGDTIHPADILPRPLMVPLLGPRIRETETRRGAGAVGHLFPDPRTPGKGLPSTDGGVCGTAWPRATAGGPAHRTGVSPGETQMRPLPSGGFESGTTA